ncbi:MAG: FAD-dependent oxidoreductase, partial [Myxococcota bacterium]
MNQKKVVILGGGVAGLSAAHELIERGFAVDIYERQLIPGGKARSYPRSPDSSPKYPFDDKQDESAPIDWKYGGLPAEHGFRFFPGFYRHLPDTMARTPRFKENADGTKCDNFDDKFVVDNLVATKEVVVASYDYEPFKLPTKMPTSLGDLVHDLEKVFGPSIIPRDELNDYALRLWQVLTSCRERRDNEYERTSWWDFIGAAQKSKAFRCYLANLTRTLVAADPLTASAKTNGNILVQLVLDAFRYSTDVDRVLTGPTNEAWIHPWLKHLLGQGCRYFIGAEVQRLKVDDAGQICGMTLQPHPEHGMQQILDCGPYGPTETAPYSGPLEVDDGDFYLSAVPVEAFVRMLKADEEEKLETLDPSFKDLRRLSESLSWMNGLLFYLKRDVKVAQGHGIFADPMWALTSISQPQFWTVKPTAYGDPDVKGILSVDISNWLEPWDPEVDHPDDKGRKAAKFYTKEEVARYTWQDICRSLARSEQPVDDSDVVYYTMDEDIENVLKSPPLENRTKKGEAMVELKNLEPLLVNEVNTWSLRPTEYTR